MVRAGNGVIPVPEAQAMADRGRRVKLIELPNAKHDLHLDRPAEWHATVDEFLDSLDQSR